MLRFITRLRIRAKERRDFWLSRQFDRRPHPARDLAMAAWSEQLGHASAALWVTACKSEGRGR